MVNLIAGRALVPELMQGQMTGEALAREARRLLTNEKDRTAMKAGLAEVRDRLSQAPASLGDPGIPAERRAAVMIQEILEGQVVHVA